MIRFIPLAAFALMVVPAESQALISLAQVDAAKAKELGIEFRTVGTGESVRVEMEFPKAGDLKGYNHTTLTVTQDGKSLVSTQLKEEAGKKDRVVVSFVADKKKLDQFSLMIVTGYGGASHGGVGYLVAVKDFVK